jgi:hypothetical protein
MFASRSRKIWLRRFAWVFALVLVAVILYVFIAPWLQLQPSSLRAARAALMALICLQLWLFVATFGPSLTRLQNDALGWSCYEWVRVCRRSRLLSLHCSWFC